VRARKLKNAPTPKTFVRARRKYNNKEKTDATTAVRENDRKTAIAGESIVADRNNRDSKILQA
jgi:hypothetical protein